MSKDAAYWEKRRKALLSQMESDEKELFKKLDALYSSEIAKLERDIAAYYHLHGEENVIEYRKLLASLSEEDAALLMERMEEYMGEFEAHGTDHISVDME